MGCGLNVGFGLLDLDWFIYSTHLLGTFTYHSSSFSFR
jgi:hypothetical protein